MTNQQAIVIGGGVAGCCAALALARRGVKTGLLEAGTFPRHKVCGEFFSPESRTVLRRLGVEKLLLDSGARAVTKARVMTARRELTIPLPGEAIALSRYRMDEVLWSASQQAGVLCYDQTRVKNIHRADHGWNVETEHETWQTEAVILATGRKNLPLPFASLTNNKLNPKHFGLKAHFRGVRLDEGVVELHPWRDGYCGLVRVENDITNICLLARYECWKKVGERTPENFWQWLLQHHPALRARMVKAERVTPWLATGNVSFGSPQPVRDGLLCCGDVAGYIHPLAGDGMAMAARSGELAAVVTTQQLKGTLSTLDALNLYQAAWQREFGARLVWASRVEPLLTNPFLTSPALAALTLWPALSRGLAARTRGL